MKVEIKLCTSSFSMVTLPISAKNCNCVATIFSWSKW